MRIVPTTPRKETAALGPSPAAVRAGSATLVVDLVASRTVGDVAGTPDEHDAPDATWIALTRGVLPFADITTWATTPRS